MAVDTKNKRMSVIGLALPVPSMLPDSDGTIAIADRLHLLWLYSGIAAATPTAPIVNRIFVVENESRIFVVSSELRTYDVER